MKKIFLTTGLLSVLVMPAMAETKWFVGAGVGYAEPVFSDNVDDLIDDDYLDDNSGTLSLALTAGMRFGEYEKIYNGGVSLTWQNMSGLGELTDGPMSAYALEADLDFMALYLTYDNYIRISGDAKCRTDFIISVGLGQGWVKETLDDGYARGTYEDDGWGVILKFGFGGETVVQGLRWSVLASVMAPDVDDDDDFQGSAGFEFGLTYTF